MPAAQAPSPPPQPSPPLPEETDIAWNWAIETLANCKEISTSVLGALISWNRGVRNNLTFEPATRERVALRYLEDWLYTTHPNDPPPPPLPATGLPEAACGIDVALPSDVVLLHNLQKVSDSNFFENCKDELYRNNLHQFILQKRAAFSKSSLDLLKDYIFEDCHQATSSLRRFRGLVRRNQVDYLHLGSDDEYEIASKKHKLNNGEFQTLKLLSTAASSISGISPGSRQQLSKQNLAVGSYSGQIDGNDNTVHAREQDFIPELPADRMPTNRSPGETENGKDQAHNPDISIDGEHSGIPEPLSNGDGYHDAAPDHVPNDEMLVTENLKLPSSQNPVDHESQVSDWTQQRLCIKCDEVGLLLICTARGCPIAVHESCLGLAVSTEDPQNFKCPLCSYLQAATAYSEAKKKVSVARKALSAFMEWDPMHQKKKTSPLEAIGSSHGRKSGSRNCPDMVHAKGSSNEIIKETEQLKQAKAVVECNEHPIHKEEDPTLLVESNDVSSGTVVLDIVNNKQSNIAAQHQQQADATIPPNCIVPLRKMVTSPVTDNHDIPLVKEEIRIDNHCQCIGVAMHHQLTECANAFTNDKLSCGEEDTSRIREMHDGSVDKGKNENSERLCTNGHVQGLKDQRPAEVATKADMGDSPYQERISVVHGKYAKGGQNPVINLALDSQGNIGNHGVKKSSSSKNRKHSAKRYTNPIFPSGRRNRLPWTPEEEEALKDAMQKFSGSAEKNIPWTKILEFCRHIFHRTRQPSDLKDKWKNIRKKEGSETGTRDISS